MLIIVLFLQLPAFLSTPSARRATYTGSTTTLARDYFYPRPPRGGRLDVVRGLAAPQDISIHALREEGDGMVELIHRVVEVISIHALREEGDRPSPCP